MEISNWVSHGARWSPEKPALRFRDDVVTYEALERRVGHRAAALQALGVDAGDRVAHLGPSAPELVELLFACARIGAIFVPLNARMPAPELSVFFAMAEPYVCVSEHALLATAREAAPNGCAVVPFWAGAGIDATPSGPPVAVDPGADGRRAVLILFTSGTTDTPKGAVMTSEALIGNAADTVAALQITSADEVLTATPMFHVAGLNLLSTPVLSVGGTVTVHESFSPSAVLEDLDAGRATLLVSSPPMTAELAAHPNWHATNMATLRCVVTGGTVVPESALRPWIERGVRVVQSYGLTEAGPHVTLVPLDDSPARATTAGKPVMHADVRIVDEQGRDVPGGAPGEIVVRGPNLMVGYWRNPVATREAIPNTWLRTGDIGVLDDDGYLHVVDRLKEIIVVGVSNVYPADLEAVLLESPDIRAAAVVGRPDDDLGEVPVAFVEPVPGRVVTRDRVLRLFDGRLARYKHPREVHVVDAMPRTSVGKPEKKALRAMAAVAPMS